MNVDLTNAILKNSNLSKKDLTKTFLHKSDLSGADLTNSNLSVVYLGDTILKDANLKFLANNPHSIDIVFNKRNFYEHMINSSLENLIPIYYKSQEDIKYPCISKPAIGTSGATKSMTSTNGCFIFLENEISIFVPNAAHKKESF